MDSNTNTPIDPDAPLPLGGPLHPKPSPPLDSPAEPSVIPSQPQIESSLPAEAFVPNAGSSLSPPSPASPLPPPAPGDAFAPTQAPLGPPQPQLPPAPGVNPAFDAQSAFKPQLVMPAPVAPVVVSGGFAPNTPMAPGVPAAAVPNATLPTATATPPPAPTPPSSTGHRLKALLIVLVGVIVLGGASAAAYFAVIVPSQPANVLKTAILNSIQQNSVNYKATVKYKGGSDSIIPPTTVTLSGDRNASAQTSAFALNASAYGVNLDLGARLVDKNLYVNAGNLKTLATVLGTYEPSLAATATTISNEVSNQWVEIDQSLLDSGGLTCFLNSKYMSLSQADINLLSSDYAKHEFLTIQKTSNVNLGTQAAEEFQVSLSNNTAAGFINNLGDLSSIKSFDSCKAGPNDGDNVAASLAHVKGNSTQTPLTIWVSKANKQVIQIGLVYKDGQKNPKEQDTISLVTALNYNNVSITAPKNAESAVQLYTKLQPTLSGLGSSGLNLLGGSSPLTGIGDSASSAATTFLKH